MKLVLSLFFVACQTIVVGQTYEYHYRNPADSTINCYLKVIPTSRPIRGVIVRDYSKLPDVSQNSPYKFLEYCTDAGFLTLYTVTSNYFPELCYTDSSTILLDEIIGEVLNEHQVDPTRVVIGGISASGTRALKYVQYCAMGKSTSGIKPRGVFAVDSPLDLERFYRSSKRLLEETNATPMGEEAKWMQRAFADMNFPDPDTDDSLFALRSVYSADRPMGGNAQYLVSTYFRLYHEPTIDWWIQQRNCRYEDFNSIDLAGCVLAIKLLGGSQCELITTHGKGRDRQGNYNPHSWAIVDEKELVEWVEKILH